MYETRHVPFCGRSHIAFWGHEMIQRRSLCSICLILVSCGTLTAQSSDLLTRIWNGVQQAQAKFTAGCGTIAETRTSALMAKPLVLHGKFCAEGTSRFMLEYFEPNPMRIQLDGDFLYLTAADGKTKKINISDDARRAQSSYRGKDSLDSLKKNFTITAQEDSRNFSLKLIPRSQRLRHRLNDLVVKFNKQDFLPRSIEVDGNNGVRSVFALELTSENKKLPENTFEGIEAK